MGNLSTTTLIGIIVVLTIVAGLLVALSQNRQQQYLLSITNFDECVAAGFPIMPARTTDGVQSGGESYPERCATPDGRTFVNERQMVPSSDEMTFNGCAVAGCSGQLCVSAEEAGDIVTTCEYRAEYVCYKEASCEPQTDGTCGWTQTAELKACLANPPALDPSDLQVF
ncbi:hypothetical protein HYW59_03070 [Candidatus Kaiserbacteria bacterium]|nr:hypothetical protein [Candidatus Kaiserbacteria bacterium]